MDREKYEFVSWDFVTKSVKKIVEALKDRKFSGVYGIPCGGYCLGVMLHHRLKIPLLSHAAKNCVICDDIADKGRSLYHYAEDRSKYFIVTLYYHRQSIVVPDLWFREKTDKWIVFPWEDIKNPE